MEDQIEIDRDIFDKFQSARIFRHNKIPINCLEFSDDGTRLLTADDYTLNIYDTQIGKKIQTLYNKQNLISLIKFTHNNEAVLMTCKQNNQIYYWSLHENEIIKIFEGHSKQIISLQIHPKDDRFMTTGMDNTLKIWNLQQMYQNPNYVLELKTGNQDNNEILPFVQYDPTGVIFALSTYDPIQEYSKIRLFNPQEIEKGHFIIFFIDCDKINFMIFSPNGNYLALSTVENSIILLDSFDGKIKNKFSNYINEGSPIQLSFTPNSQFLISGSEDGKIHVWDVENENENQKLIRTIDAHIKPCLNVKFSQHTCLMVSACNNLIFWLPK